VRQRVMCSTLMLRLVQPVDNDIGLGHAQRIEVLAHCQSELVLVDPSFRLWSRHGGRKAADALAKDDVAQWVLERGRGVETVRSAVALQDRRFL
jgi:hypothetical protein